MSAKMSAETGWVAEPVLGLLAEDELPAMDNM